MLLLLVLGFGIGNGCYRALSRKDEMDKRNRVSGEQIVRALEQYREDNSVYPAELKLLQPAHLKEVPLMRWREQDSGRPFGYEVMEDGKRFKLSYDEAPLTLWPADAAFEYDSHTREWRHVVF